MRLRQLCRLRPSGRSRALTQCSCLLAHLSRLLADLTKYASHVYVLVRKGELRASRIMAKRLENHPKCTIMWNTEATECLGDGDLLNALSIVNNKTQETSKLEVNGLFYAIGHVPAVELVKDQVKTDEDGYIVTIPGTAQTSIKAVFAAGDVQVRSWDDFLRFEPKLSRELCPDRPKTG